MKKMILSGFIGTFLFGMVAWMSPALAHTYVWEDPDFHYTLKFPDTWKMQGGMSPAERFHMVAPSDDAQCFIQAFNDARFVVYPRRYDRDILADDIQWTYWEYATASGDDRFFHFDKEGSLGQGEARYTMVDYNPTTGDTTPKREIIFASIYDDMHFVARCVADKDNFSDYRDDFTMFIQSIDFEPAYTYFGNGYYRDFLGHRKKSVKQRKYSKFLPKFWLDPILVETQ